MWWAIQSETANWELRVRLDATHREKLNKSKDLLRSGMRSTKVAQELAFPSVMSFRRAFVKEFGETPITWAVRNKRDTSNGLLLKVAERLMLKTDLSLGEISRQSGFSQHSHFSFTFKRVHGVTPGQWRASKRTVRGR